MHSEGQRVALGLLSWVALEGWVGSQGCLLCFYGRGIELYLELEVLSWGTPTASHTFWVFQGGVLLEASFPLFICACFFPLDLE